MTMALVSAWENLRIRLAGPLKEQWDALLERKRISQQDAIVALVEFLLDQDDVAQSMIFKQVAPSDDLIALALRRMRRDGTIPHASQLRTAAMTPPGMNKRKPDNKPKG